MSRLHNTFTKLKAKNQTALVGFISAGDPDVTTSLDIISSMFDNGLDILELGVPFSDPTADGDVIQRSSLRAIKSGITLPIVLDMVKKLRTSYSQPIIIFSYLNPIFKYGYEKFVADAVDSGADGLLVVDMPFEESDEFIAARDLVCCKNDFALIKLIAPTTDEQRLERICESSEGFIYMINRVGITGAGGVDPQSVACNASRIKKHTSTPVCMGFGVSSPQDVSLIAKSGDGVVVGSLFEKAIEQNLENENVSSVIGQLVKELKQPTFS